MAINPREIRRQYAAAKAVPKQFVPVEGPALAWRNVAHHSTQIYMVSLRRDARGELEAEHSVITVKCEYKRTGFARPTVREVESWQQLIGPLP